MRLLVSYLGFCLLVATPIANATLLSPEVGLDGPTRALIDRMPSNIREQTIKALQDAQPIIDKSVLLYLSKITGIVSSTVSQARCLATGVVKETGDTVGLFFRGLNPLSRAQSTILTPVRDLYNDAIATRGRITSSTTAQDISVAYADLLYRIGRTACQVSSISPLSGTSVQSLDSDIIPRSLIWLQLAGTCVSPSNCYVARLSQIRDLLKSSDKRDVTALNADARFAALPAKDDEPGAWGRFWNKLDLDSYEKGLGELRLIEQGLSVAKAVRDQQSEDALIVASRLVDAIAANLLQAKNDLAGNTTNIDTINRSRSLATKAGPMKDDVTAKIASARAISNIVDSDATSLQSRCNTIAATAGEIITKADELNKARIANNEAHQEWRERHQPN